MDNIVTHYLLKIDKNISLFNIDHEEYNIILSDIENLLNNISDINFSLNDDILQQLYKIYNYNLNIKKYIDINIKICKEKLLIYIEQLDNGINGELYKSIRVFILRLEYLSEEFDKNISLLNNFIKNTKSLLLHNEKIKFYKNDQNDKRSADEKSKIYNEEIKKLKQLLEIIQNIINKEKENINKSEIEKKGLQNEYDEFNLGVEILRKSATLWKVFNGDIFTIYKVDKFKNNQLGNDKKKIKSKKEAIENSKQKIEENTYKKIKIDSKLNILLLQFNIVNDTLLEYEKNYNESETIIINSTKFIKLHRYKLSISFGTIRSMLANMYHQHNTLVNLLKEYNLFNDDLNSFNYDSFLEERYIDKINKYNNTSPRDSFEDILFSIEKLIKRWRKLLQLHVKNNEEIVLNRTCIIVNDNINYFNYEAKYNQLNLEYVHIKDAINNNNIVDARIQDINNVTHQIDNRILELQDREARNKNEQEKIKIKLQNTQNELDILETKKDIYSHNLERDTKTTCQVSGCCCIFCLGMLSKQLISYNTFIACGMVTPLILGTAFIFYKTHYFSDLHDYYKTSILINKLKLSIQTIIKDDKEFDNILHTIKINLTECNNNKIANNNKIEFLEEINKDKLVIIKRADLINELKDCKEEIKKFITQYIDTEFKPKLHEAPKIQHMTKDKTILKSR